MNQKRYSNFLDQDQFAQYKYHEGNLNTNFQTKSIRNNRISDFYQNYNDQNLQANQICNSNHVEIAKGLQDIKRQNQLYLIGLKFKKIQKEDFIQNTKIAEFTDPYGNQCICHIGNEVEYPPQFKNNEVYYLKGVQLYQYRKQDNFFQIMIQKGKITEQLPNEKELQIQMIEEGEQQSFKFNINSSNQNQSIINILQLLEQPQQVSEKKTYFNILAIIIQQSEVQQIWSQKRQKHFDCVKIEVMDQDGQRDSITLWNKFLQLQFTPYQIVFFQNLDLQTLKEQKYLQTIDKISIIITDDERLQLLSNYYELKAVATKHQENEKFRKLISYQEIQQLNPI